MYTIHLMYVNHDEKIYYILSPFFFFYVDILHMNDSDAFTNVKVRQQNTENYFSFIILIKNYLNQEYFYQKKKLIPMSYDF